MSRLGRTYANNGRRGIGRGRVVDMDMNAMQAARPGVARTGRTDDGMVTPGEFLIFRLGGEEYGVDILSVQEIRSYEPPTRIANAPAYIKGVLNLRGLIVPIVDLRMKYTFTEAAYNDLTVVVMLNLDKRIVGAVVDGVSDVVDLDEAHLRPAPDIGQSSQAGFVRGIGAMPGEAGERMLILVDIEKMMKLGEGDLASLGIA